MSLAPIIVFAYKRPALLQGALESLARNPGAASSSLTVHCDGPKPGATPAELQAIEQVRRTAAAAEGFASVRVSAAERNLGLAASVIAGVGRAVGEHGRAIMVEEDVVVSSCFLEYMNDALRRFADDARVLSVGAWNYYAPGLGRAPAFFSRFPDSIAWGTWKRAWGLFEPDAAKLQGELARRRRMRALEADGAVRYFGPMLQAQIDGRVDSWAIRWTAVSVLHGKLNLLPREAMARHEGFDADATHERHTDDYNAGLALAAAPPDLSAVGVEESREALAQWARFVKERFHAAPPGLLQRFWRRIPAGLRARIRRQLPATA